MVGQALVESCRARVEWRLIARSGLTTVQTLQLLQRESAWHADVAVVVSGVNAVVDQVPSHHAVPARETLANWLRNGAGVHHVVFAPLPPIHLFPGLPQPLRWTPAATPGATTARCGAGPRHARMSRASSSPCRWTAA